MFPEMVLFWTTTRAADARWTPPPPPSPVPLAALLLIVLLRIVRLATLETLIPPP